MSVSPFGATPNSGGLLGRMYPRQVPTREENSAAWPVTLMVHVGPHKTATTTIQAALAHNGPHLSTKGIFVPPGTHPNFAGHHHLPFLLQGKSLVPLGLTDSNATIGDLIDEWLTGARDNGAHRVVVSPEDFDALEEELWLAFERELQQSAARTNTVVSGLVIHFTRREIESRLVSSVGNFYIHGASLPRDELIERLRADVAHHDNTIERLPGLLSTPTEVSYFDFGEVVAAPEAARSTGFALGWFAHVLGPEDAEGIVIAEESARLIPALSAATLDELREFNVINNPAHADAVRPFERIDGDPELERAFARLNYARNVYMARDAVRDDVARTANEIDVLRSAIEEARAHSRRARVRSFLRRGQRRDASVSPDRASS